MCIRINNIVIQFMIFILILMAPKSRPFWYPVAHSLLCPLPSPLPPLSLHL